MSLITQIQDLFPDLGSGYIVRLLDFYGDTPETIIAHLLDESIPSELQDLDKSEQLPTTSTTAHHDPLPPRSTPPPPTELPIRKNIFDNDIDLAEFARSDQLPNTTAGAKNALRFGRANPTLTADDLLSDRSNHTAQKAAIISALAAFDSDDDERDDTYDVADVGGTVDATDEGTDQQQPKSADELDLTLLQTFKSNPALFSRDSATRRGQPRASLKRETGMTDEAIEGWAVMLTRDPKRLAKLEDRLALSAAPGAGMAQPELASTSYRRPKASGDGEEESGTEGEQHSSMRGRGRGRGGLGRGRGRGRGGGGGGPSGDQNTAASRQRKEENKASRANHNRRQQRAKKVARAGGMVG
jgi:activating signal cointegrator complex subunit 2